MVNRCFPARPGILLQPGGGALIKQPIAQRPHRIDAQCVPTQAPEVASRLEPGRSRGPKLRAGL